MKLKKLFTIAFGLAMTMNIYADATEDMKRNAISNLSDNLGM